MAQIRFVDVWLRAPGSPPSHWRSVMVISEKWAEQRVLMRAFAESRDQTLPTIMLHGVELAIGPAGTNSDGPWGIHVGEQVDGRYLVWGWNGIANRVVSREEYRPIFHEARYNIALCRTRLAQVKTGGERAELLKQAELDITRTYQLYPKMGGPEWFEKYDALLKAIRKFRNQPNPKGLRDA